LNFIGFVLALPQAFAEDRPASTVDLGMSEVTRTNLDAFSGMRFAPATLPLVSRYQAQGSAVGQVSDDFGYHVGASVMDSSTGPVAMGLQVQYATGEAPLEGDALPGWKLPEEDLVRDFADLGITAAGAVSFLNRQYGLGMSATYLGRTYLTRSDGGSLILDFVMDRTEETRVHELELNASASAKVADVLVVAAGFNDWLGISGYRRPFASARFGVVDAPMQGFYENVGGVEVDIEGAWNSDGFGLGLVGVAGDVRISQVFLRGGYQYDGVDVVHKPGLGFGLDDGRVSLDYGVQIYLQESAVQSHWHSLGVRFRI
jgi:hypothetical protein